MTLTLVRGMYPIFQTNTENGDDINVMLDTGVTLSVYLADAELLKLAFPSCYKTELFAETRGFGGDISSTPVYIIPRFVIGDLEILDLPIIALPNSNFPCDIVLSSWVLSNVKFLIDYRNKQLEILSTDHVIHCGIAVKPNSNNLKRFYIYANGLCDYTSNKSAHSLSKELEWCRAHAPEAIKDLPDEELWDIMKGSYYAAEGL